MLRFNLTDITSRYEEFILDFLGHVNSQTKSNRYYKGHKVPVLCCYALLIYARLD